MGSFVVQTGQNYEAQSPQTWSLIVGTVRKGVPQTLWFVRQSARQQACQVTITAITNEGVTDGRTITCFTCVDARGNIYGGFHVEGDFCNFH